MEKDINIIKVEFGRKNNLTVSNRYQYDKGQIIKFLDIPDGAQVEFANENHERAEPYIVRNSQVEIPDFLVEENSPIVVYVKVVDENSETTVKTIIIPVISRPESDDGVPPENQQTFKQQIQEIMDSTKQIAQSVRNDADNDKFKGDKGEPGTNGEDGYTPVKGVDYFTEDEKVEIVQDVAERIDLSDKPTKFKLKGNNEPTTNASEYPDVKLGDICVNEAYRAWICQYLHEGSNTVVWSEIITPTSPYLPDNYYQKNVIENKLEYKADKTYVDSAINAVNQFKISIVTELPTENIDTHTIYFIPKTDTDINDNYDEWIYLNENWEHIGNTVIDLSGYVKNTNLAGINKLGLVQIPYDGGIGVSGSGSISIDRATSIEIEGLNNQYKPIVPSNLRKAVETIGGVVNNLNTEDKTDYVAAINEVLKFATRERTWKKIRTITIPSDEFKGQTIDGVRYGYKNNYGIKEIGFKTDKDGNELSLYKITGLQLKVTPTVKININQGFASVGSMVLSVSEGDTIDYFTVFKNTTTFRWFEYSTEPQRHSMLANNPGQHVIPGKRHNFIDAFAWGGFEETSILGEGTKVEVWAYGYFDEEVVNG